MEIPEIQTASKELGEWIKQLEQHSFKLQHYATEIENWASEEEEVDSIELTDLIKDLEATLTDLRKGRTPGISSADDDSGSVDNPEKMLRGYGIAGRVIKEPKALPKAEIRTNEEKGPVKPVATNKNPVEEIKKEQARTPQGILIAKDVEKPKAKAELPTGSKEIVTRESEKPGPEEDETRGYMTPEGFLIRRLRP